MCGIAGIIYRDGTHEVGRDMTRMLQSMKHRGPDSTGYALYRPPANGNGSANGAYAMRLKLADANTPRDFEFHDRLRRHRAEVEHRLAAVGANVEEIEASTEYAFNVTLHYDGDLKELADRVESVPGAEVLSIGHSLQIDKDLGDAESVAAKPLVLYEADDLVALASEEVAIRQVVDREIDTYDPYEGEVMVWQR